MITESGSSSTAVMPIRTGETPTKAPARTHFRSAPALSGSGSTCSSGCAPSGPHIVPAQAAGSGRIKLPEFSNAWRRGYMRSDEPDGGEAAAAVAPGICTGLTLFKIEEGIALLAESAEEEGLTPEIERALAAYLEGALEKRDRVADFIHFREGMAELAKAEGKRLQARQKHFEATAERVSAMVLRVRDYLGGNKLEGPTNTLKKRKCPPSVRIVEQSKVPAEYKHITA